jgi:hypothetical protein
MRTFQRAVVLSLLTLGCREAETPAVAEASGASEDKVAAAPQLPRQAAVEGIWMRREEIQKLPMTGRAWQRLEQYASKKPPYPNLTDQNTRTNVVVLAKALVYARTGEERYREEVVTLVRNAMGTERGSTTLPLGRKLISYVIAAELVSLPPEHDERFRKWLSGLMQTKFRGRTLRSTHEDRPNNWGTHAGASRVAIARYLGLDEEVARCARVFRGWLGGREYYDGFKYGDLSWQADESRPVGINPVGATKNNHSIDGVLADDQRLAGSFTWPPPHENYVYEALQGVLAQAVMLQRAGYTDVWEWEDRALLRAFRWLNEVARFHPEGDDTWQAPLIDAHYGTRYWDGSPTRPGKSLGWTDWTHAAEVAPTRSPRPAP